MLSKLKFLGDQAPLTIDMFLAIFKKSNIMNTARRIEDQLI